MISGHPYKGYCERVFIRFLFCSGTAHSVNIRSKNSRSASSSATLSTRVMWIIAISSLLLFVSVRSEDENCAVAKYVECMEPIHNATFGHEHGLFQDSGDLYASCPIITKGISCIRKYASDCGTEMIAENFQEQFEKPAGFLTKICDSNSNIRRDYLKASPCMRENEDDLEICSTKVQEFLAFFEADTEEKEYTMTCMFEMMLRACLMSTAAEKCGMETANFVRKALLYSPALGLETCSKEGTSAKTK